MVVGNAVDATPTEITYGGCRNYSILDNPVVIEEGTDLTLSLYIDLRELVRVVDLDDLPGEQYSSCTWTAYTGGVQPTDPVICAFYPNVAGTLSVSEPNLRRYTLSTDGTSANMLGLYFDDSNKPVGGYMRAYYEDGTYEAVPQMLIFKRAYLNGTDLVVTDYGYTDGIDGDGQNTFLSFPWDIAIGAPEAGVETRNPSGNLTGTYTVERIE